MQTSVGAWTNRQSRNTETEIQGKQAEVGGGSLTVIRAQYAWNETSGALESGTQALESEAYRVS